MTAIPWRAGLAPARFFFGAAKEGASALLDLVYPPVCMSCGSRPARGFCDPCLLEALGAPGPTCGLCGRFLRAPGIACKDCRTTSFFFSRAAGAARYHGFLRALIRRFKLGNEPHLAAPLGEIAADKAEAEFRAVDAVVPVPLGRLKLIARGYNQAELLAIVVAKRLGKPLFPKALKRLRKAGKQAFLTRGDRLANSLGLYAPAKPILGRAPDLKGKRILLVDDVITTGATASACARALRDAGARDVVAVAVGR